MEQFIGCDAHKTFSVFVAVNEKGHASEALRVAHDRQLYREFLARLDNSIRCRRSAVQARPVFRTTSIHPGPRGAERPSACIRARHSEHLMARANHSRTM